jgi:hypothetical protein
MSVTCRRSRRRALVRLDRDVATFLIRALCR